MIQILVERCGGGVSVQDAGRRGWGHMGVPRSGALDMLALRIANALVGNVWDSAAIEFCLSGAVLRVAGGSVRFASAGAPTLIKIDDMPVASHSSFMLAPGQRLKIQPGQAGVCSVLAVEGGLDLPMVLGSRSLYRRGEIGGFLGRALRDGDLLTVNRPARARTEMVTRPLDMNAASSIRVVMGPQDSYFTETSIRSFLSQRFIVTHESDRMGYRLSGKPIPSMQAAHMISDGIAEGSVQITGSGLPIVLLADHQTTGGYPKIATVISADIRLVAQRRPGDAITFEAISIAESQSEARQAKHRIEAFSSDLAPLLETARLNAAFTNVADSAVNACDPQTWEWHGPLAAPIASVRV
jgi:5-oxoprolinase (ATP-hydrolysing) subunit C